MPFLSEEAAALPRTLWLYCSCSIWAGGSKCWTISDFFFSPLSNPKKTSQTAALTSTYFAVWWRKLFLFLSCCSSHKEIGRCPGVQFNDQTEQVQFAAGFHSVDSLKLFSLFFLLLFIREPKCNSLPVRPMNF